MNALSFPRFAAFLILVSPLQVLHAASPAAPVVPAPPKPKPLIDFNSPDASKQVAAVKNITAGSTITVDKGGIAVTFPVRQGKDANHPGFHLTPADGKPWDLSAYGDVAVSVTNTGDTDLKINVHVVPTGEAFAAEQNQEGLQMKPGESKVIKVIFGYSKGLKPAPPINSASIDEIYIFLYHSGAAHSFHIDSVTAGGVPGEKPDTTSP